MSSGINVRSTNTADRLLFALLVFLSLGGMVFAREQLSSLRDVLVTVDGRPAYHFPLDSDRSVRIEGRHGSVTLEIRDRRVRVIDASCENRICERQGWLGAGAIICAPSHITITVGGGKGIPAGVDAVSG